MPPARLLMTAVRTACARSPAPLDFAPRVDEPGAPHVAVGHLVAHEVDRVIRGERRIHQRVRLRELDRVEAAVVLGHLLLDDVGLDGDPEVVGLAREVGRDVVVDAVLLEGVVAQVAPQDGGEPQLVGAAEALRDLPDLPARLRRAEVHGRAHRHARPCRRPARRSRRGSGRRCSGRRRLVVVQLHHERDAVGVAPRGLEHAERRGDAVAAASTPTSRCPSGSKHAGLGAKEAPAECSMPWSTGSSEQVSGPASRPWPKRAARLRMTAGLRSVMLTPGRGNPAREGAGFRLRMPLQAWARRDSASAPSREAMSVMAVSAGAWRRQACGLRADEPPACARQAPSDPRRRGDQQGRGNRPARLGGEDPHEGPALEPGLEALDHAPGEFLVHRPGHEPHVRREHHVAGACAAAKSAGSGSSSKTSSAAMPGRPASSADGSAAMSTSVEREVFTRIESGRMVASRARRAAFASPPTARGAGSPPSRWRGAPRAGPPSPRPPRPVPASCAGSR